MNYQRLAFLIAFNWTSVNLVMWLPYICLFLTQGQLATPDRCEEDYLHTDVSIFVFTADLFDQVA